MDDDDLEIKLMDFDATSGAIPITWCLGKNLTEKIGDEIDKYLVFILTTPLTPNQRSDSRREWRTFCSLQDMMAYVTFLRPGASRIFAFIVHKTDARDIDRWMQKHHRWGFDDEVLTYYDQELGRDLVLRNDTRLVRWARAKASLDIDLPQECFADKPPQWLMDWATCLWPYIPEDQCAFRRRLIFAFTLQIPIVLCLIAFFCTFRFLVALCLTLLGFRKVNWRPVIHPFDAQWDSEDIWRKTEGSFLCFPSLPYTMKWGLAALPLTLILSSSLTYLFAIDLRLQVSLTSIILYFLILLACISVVFPLWVLFVDWVLFDVFNLNWLNDHWLFRWMDYRTERKNEILAWKKERMRLEADLLLCSKSHYRRLMDLPRRKRTLKLLFKDTKSKVCKPFPM